MSTFSGRFEMPDGMVMTLMFDDIDQLNDAERMVAHDIITGTKGSSLHHRNSPGMGAVLARPSPLPADAPCGVGRGDGLAPYEIAPRGALPWPYHCRKAHHSPHPP